jgi:hypothetical protein
VGKCDENDRFYVLFDCEVVRCVGRSGGGSKIRNKPHSGNLVSTLFEKKQIPRSSKKVCLSASYLPISLL